MKKLITLLLLIASSNLFAQTDSFEVKETKLVKAYNFLTMAKKEERKVWKVDAFPFLMSNLNMLWNKYEFFNSSLRYEQKISPALSLNIEGVVDMSKQKIHITESSGSLTVFDITEYNNKLSLELKWYYNLLKRMHRHHTANNFSASYISVKASRQIYYSSNYIWAPYQSIDNAIYPENSNNPFFADFKKGTFNNNNLTLYHGFQRRFLKIAYFDIQTGVIYKYSSPYITANYKYTYSPFSSDKLSRILPFLNIKLGFAF